MPLIFALALASMSTAQGRSSEDIRRQIRELKADKMFTLTYDQGSDATKLLAVAENLPQKEAEKAGTQAINFATAFTFSGKILKTAPAAINLSFWVMAKKPQFAAAHRWIVTAGAVTVDLGEARYTAKPADNMEYLNFVVTRDDLKKISAAGAKFKLGNADFTFTPAQTKLLADLVTISTP